MPRRGAIERSVYPIVAREPRVRPPADLGATDAEIFRAIVSGAPASQFCIADTPLLVAYVQAIRISRASADDPALLPQWERATRIIGQLAPKLRLSPSSRLDRKTAGRAIDRHTPSYYDRMADEQEAG
jgi:hypothetical protein